MHLCVCMVFFCVCVLGWVGGCTCIGVSGNRSLRLMWEIILHGSPALFNEVGSLNQTQSSLLMVALLPCLLWRSLHLQGLES